MTDSSIPIRGPPHSEDKIGRFNGEGNQATFGFVPQMVTAKQVEALLVSGGGGPSTLDSVSIAEHKNIFLMLGWDHKPFQPTTVLRAVQIDAGEPQETPNVYPNDRVLRNGK